MARGVIKRHRTIINSLLKIKKCDVDFVLFLNIASGMIVKCNTEAPIPIEGERNVMCKHYGDCLDIAVEKNWKCWSCASFCKYNL